VISQREHTDAVVAKLETLDLPVGDGKRPEGDDARYCVVYPIPGGSLDGTLEDPNEDAELVFQVTCVGTTREQAEWVSDKVLGLLTGMTVAGRHIARIYLDSFSGVRRDDTLSPPMFIGTPRFRVMSTPA
jgi:hypothetical protein